MGSDKSHSDVTDTCSQVTNGGLTVVGPVSVVATDCTTSFLVFLCSNINRNERTNTQPSSLEGATWNCHNGHINPCQDIKTGGHAPCDLTEM